VTIHQDADLYTTTLRDGASVTQNLRPGRYGWVHVARGNVTVNGQPLAAGDGAAIEAEPRVTIAGDGEVLLFDLA
jgi:redox-sensitive bicupin YhaK (pirin superfamily)